MQAILQYQQAQQRRLLAGELDAAKISEADDPGLAAWVMVARAVMNLDEAITKP